MEAATRVMGHFREMADDGAGVLLITHDLELALLTADRIVVLYGGRVIEETDAAAFQNEENLKHPYTKALFRSMPKNWKRTEKTSATQERSWRSCERNTEDEAGSDRHFF